MKELLSRLTFKGYSIFISTFLILLFIPLVTHGVLKTPLVITVSNQRTGEPMEKVEFRVFNENGEPIDGGESGKDGIVGTLDVAEGSSGTVFITKKGLKPQVVEFGPGKYEQNISLALQPLSFVRLSKSKLEAGTTPTKGNIPEFLTLPGDKINKADPFFEPIKNLGGFPPGLEIDFVNIFPFGGFTTGQNQYQFHQVDIHYDKELPGDIDMDTVDTPEPAESFLAFAPAVIRDKEPEDSIVENISLPLELDIQDYGTSYSKGGSSGGGIWYRLGGGKPYESTIEPEPVGSGGGGTRSGNRGYDVFDSGDGWGVSSYWKIQQRQPSVTERDIPLTGQKNVISFPDDPMYQSRGSWDQDYDDQWGLKRIGFTPKDHKDSAWNAAPGTGEPVVVAVIDSGCDLTHPELNDVFWRNKDEIANNGKDDDENGFVDDLHGWNFMDNNNELKDFNGHGTVNSGIIAARINNGMGIAGVNPQAKIMVVKALNFELEGGSINLGKAIIYAINNGARVINISIGGVKSSRFVQMAINYARHHGAVVVAASGNEGINNEDYTPAGLANVIAVAATDTTDSRTNFSNWGQAVDISAPGMDILSLRARGTDLLALTGPEDYKPGSAVVGKDGEYYRVSGTSFAAPLVSGLASLILSHNPSLTPPQVQRMILSTADDIEVPGWDQYSGFGLVNGGKALGADPDYITVAKITGLVPMEKKGKPVVQIQGTAFSTDFDKRWLELGFGEKPKRWKRVGKKEKNSVIQGTLGEIQAKKFTKPGNWSVRLMVKTKAHGVMEAWGALEIQ